MDRGRHTLWGVGEFPSQQSQLNRVTLNHHSAAVSVCKSTAGREVRGCQADPGAVVVLLRCIPSARLGRTPPDSLCWVLLG